MGKFAAYILSAAIRTPEIARNLRIHPLKTTASCGFERYPSRSMQSISRGLFSENPPFPHKDPMQISSFLRAGAIAALAAAALPAQSLSTTFAGGNGNAAGGGVYFDVNVTNAMGIAVLSMDINSSSVAGDLGSIDVYTTPGTHVGVEGNMALWTLQSSGTFTSAGAGLPTTVTLASPVILPMGAQGIAVCYNGFGSTYTNGNGTNQTYMNADLTLTAGSSDNSCLASATVFSPRVWNGALNYAIGTSDFATTAKYGSGCGASAGSIYESFDGGISAFDLGGAPAAENVIRASFGGSTYVVTPGASAFFTPTSAALALTDDSVSPQVLPFPMPLTDGTMTNDITISSNGFVTLNGTNTNSDFSESVGELLGQDPRIALLWDDLNVADATTPGAIHFDVDPSGNAVYVTYLAVVEFGGAAPNTAQLMIDNAGNFELRYGTVGLLDALVGFSLGGGASDPGNTDLSAITSVMTGVDANNMSLCSDARPLTGTTVNLVTEDIPATALVGATIFSLGQINPGAPTPFAGCELFVGAGTTLLFIPAGSTTNSQALSIPNDPALSGVMVYAQSAVLTGVGPLAGLTSNGVELVVGLN